MHKPFTKLASFAALTGALGLAALLGACAETSQGPQLANPPAKSQGPARAPDQSGQAGQAGQAQQPQVAHTGPGARPPTLPSLEELLGRLPGATEQAQPGEPPLVPLAQGMRVAVLLPLSGPNQRIGSSLLNAAEMALFEFAGLDFEILVHDTKGTPEGAAEAARLAIADGAQLIVGPLLASSVRAIDEQARAAGVPIMAFSSDRAIVGDGVYTMGFFPGDEVRRVMQYASSQGAVRFGLLAPRGAYGDAVLNAMQAASWTMGVEVSSVGFYDPQASEFSEPVKNIANFDQRKWALDDQRRTLQARGDEVSQLALKRMENLQTLGPPPFDALLVADGGKRLIAVAAMLPFYDIDPKEVHILGTGQWDEQSLGAEPALVGGWYAAPDPDAREAFAVRYADVFGSRPHRLATLAYDATALAVVLARQNPERPYQPDVLTQPSGFAGRDGIFRFQGDGAVERGLAVLQVDRHGTRVVDGAPKAFAAETGGDAAAQP